MRIMSERLIQRLGVVHALPRGAVGRCPGGALPGSWDLRGKPVAAGVPLPASRAAPAPAPKLAQIEPQPSSQSIRPELCWKRASKTAKGQHEQTPDNHVCPLYGQTEQHSPRSSSELGRTPRRVDEPLHLRRRVCKLPHLLNRPAGLLVLLEDPDVGGNRRCRLGEEDEAMIRH